MSVHGGWITQPHGCWEGSWELENSTCVCTGRGRALGHDGCNDFQLFGFQGGQTAWKDSSCHPGWSKMLPVSVVFLSLFFHTCLCVCICMCTRVDADARSQPRYLFSECCQPCSLSQSFSILPGTHELGWAGWLVSTGPPFLISSLSALRSCTITSSLFLGGFWDHSQSFLLAKQALY